MSGAGPSVHAGHWPSWTVLKFPPAPGPAPIAPPYEAPSLRTPFPIPEDTFRAALSFKVPLTIATIYATSVIILNQYNKARGYKPWSISKTRAFKAFVILHNVFLAVYSAVTCYAMFHCLKRTFPHFSEHNAVAGIVDALCKPHGPRGLGDATYYSNDLNMWVNKNPLIELDTFDGPPTSDVGRMWNEGLAWWGWWFYLSKFYEVLDTLIILAKGKRSSTLQTYHHTGAMLCMWAGIRYMASPIWIFCLVNSGIHALMYTYYTVSALGYRVHQTIKRTLTTCQILQFILGASLAAMHLFVSYSVPVSVPYEVTEKIVSTATVAAPSIAETLGSPTALATSTGIAVAFLKKLVYRAAGEEGLAENVPGAGNAGYAPEQLVRQAIVQDATQQKIVYRTEYHAVPCIDTSGQAFAVYLNVIYLAPLTFLFARFFVKSYLRRTSPGVKHTTKKNAITKSATDAVKGVNKEIESLGKAPEDTDSITGAAPRGSRPNTKRVESLSPEEIAASVQRKASLKLEELGDGAEATKERARKLAKEIVARAEEEEVKANGTANGKSKRKTNGRA